MPRLKTDNQRLSQSLEQIVKQRFVHSLSDIIYDKVGALWHIDKESEKLMAQIASRVVVGMFCLKYLSHINSLVKRKAGIKRDITALALSDENFMAEMKSKLSNKETSELFRRTARRMKQLLDSMDIKTLEDLTKIAHTGDYLLSSLDGIKNSDGYDYELWLHSMPYYYEKDLRHLGLVKTGFDLFSDAAAYEQFPAESFYLEKMHSDHRINLNAHLTPEPTEQDYFPCIRTKSKDKNTYSKLRS